MSAPSKIQKAIDFYLYDDETVVLADGFEDAFIGIGRKFDGVPFATYDRQKCIELLIEQGLNSESEADEYFSFNVEGAYVGENTPVFILVA